jgi:two-component system, sporulation sensor kinase E
MDHPHKNRTIIIISLFTIIVGIIVMLGWIFSIQVFQEIVPGFEPMRFNASLCFVLSGIALLLTQYKTRRYNNLPFVILSFLVTLIGAITLSQDLFHFNSGLDQLFITNTTGAPYYSTFPGRMAFNASVNFFLLGLGFLALTVKKRLFYRISQCFFHLVTLFSTVALIGYLYGVSLFRSLFYVSSMATHTAILFFILSLGASLLNPSIGITRMFTGKQVGDKMAKRLFTLIFLMIIIFGSLRIKTPYFQLHSSIDIGISLLAVCFLLVSLLLIWNTANWLNRSDKRRSVAEAEVKLMNAELEKRVEERSAEIQKSEEKYRSLIEQASDAICVIDFNRKFTEVNASMCKMMGYTRDELLGLNADAIVDPEELKTEPLQQKMNTPGQFEVRERRFIRKDGFVFPVEINAKMFSDDRILVIARDITERKEAEELILKEKTLSEAIINSLPGIYYLRNEKGEYLRWNKNFETISGYTTEEIGKLNAKDLMAKENQEKVMKAYEKVFEEGYAMVETIGVTKDGTRIPFLLSVAPIIYENQRCLLGTGIDISSRINAEEELRSSEQKYKLLFESNPLPMWMIAKDDLSIIAVNEAAANHYGYTKDELLKMSVTALRPNEDIEQQMEGYRKDAGGSTDFGIVRHLKKDGTIMFVQLIAHDIIFEGRSVRLSLTNDITEKLKAEESLRKSEANLQTILKTTDTAYGLFDTELKLLAFNQKAAQFTEEQYGHIPEKGDRIADYFPQERFPQFKQFAIDVLNGSHINYEIDYPQANGSVCWYYVRLSPIINENQEILGIMMALYDITERKNAEQDLKNAYERIQSHISSMKEMAWKQSHLVRSPLANMKALVTMLKDSPSDTEVLSHLQNELDRMDAIIHEIAAEASIQDV